MAFPQNEKSTLDPDRSETSNKQTLARIIIRGSQYNIFLARYPLDETVNRNSVRFAMRNYALIFQKKRN